MGTLQIILPGAAFPTNFPRAYPDPILTEGSLLLLDFSHTAGYDDGVNVPVGGTTMLPNVAWESASRLLGAGDRTSLSPVFQQTGFTGSSDAVHLTEWTGKKALHTIVSQTTSVQNKSVSIPFPTAIRNHIFANAPGHDFYISFWQRITRAQVIASDSQPCSYFASSSGASSNYLYLAQPTGLATPGTDDYVNPAGHNVAEAKLVATRVNAWNGTRPATNGDLIQRLWNVGSADAWASANTTQIASRALYRVYIEDLTASGRTFTQVRNADQALWTAAFSSGGKFYNDTFTAPSTIP